MTTQDQAVDTSAVAPEAAPAPELTIVDLQNLRSIIDVAARRGAFGAAEMTAVGGTFNKLDAFLAVAAPQVPAQTEEQPADQPTA
jgi:hypothetical protein